MMTVFCYSVKSQAGGVGFGSQKSTTSTQEAGIRVPWETKMNPKFFFHFVMLHHYFMSADVTSVVYFNPTTSP